MSSAGQGTQSVERTLRLLRLLATRGEFGWRLADLAAASDLDKGTTHRLLACLLRERMVQQRAADRRYLPGPMLYELGLSLPGWTRLQHAAEQRLKRLAAQTGAIAWLILRSGSDYVCAVREGVLELRGMMVRQGTRRPLFTSVGGAAILCTLPASEMREVLRHNRRQEIAHRGTARLAALRRVRQRTRRHGIGLNLGDIVPGVNAFAAVVRDTDDCGIAAVCLTCAAGQYGEAELPALRPLLEEAAVDIQALFKLLLGDTRADESLS